MSTYVFLTDCADFGEAQVVKSFLVSQGFHPKVRDEQMRAVAPHLQNLLGKLIVEIPEHEFIDASQALENLQRSNIHVVPDEAEQTKEEQLTYTQGMAKKALLNAVLGCVFIPVLCNLYSVVLGWRVMAAERPLTRISRTRILMSLVFNAIGFYLWLAFGLKYFLQHV